MTIVETQIGMLRMMPYRLEFLGKDASGVAFNRLGRAARDQSRCCEDFLPGMHRQRVRFAHHARSALSPT